MTSLGQLTEVVDRDAGGGLTGSAGKLFAHKRVSMISGFAIARESQALGTNISLTPSLEQFAQSCVESGRYSNIGEVVRSALDLLQEREEARAAFVQSLQEATDEARRDGFRTEQDVEASVMAVIAEVREPQEWPPQRSRPLCSHRWRRGTCRQRSGGSPPTILDQPRRCCVPR